MTSTRYERVSIEAGDTRVEVHGPDCVGGGFTVVTATPCALHNDVVRQAIAVGGMLVAAPTWPMTRKRLAEAMPGDREANLALTREMRDGDYAPLRKAGVPRYAPTYGTVELTDTDDAVDFLGFLATLGVTVELHD